jgi:hypothetical protein
MFQEVADKSAAGMGFNFAVLGSAAGPICGLLIEPTSPNA